MMLLKMSISYYFALYAFFANVAVGFASTCSGIIRNWEGSINSPNYPQAYPNSTSCTWYLFSPGEHVQTLTIVVQDLDMEQDLKCLMETFGPCCTHSWLSLPFDDLGGQRSVVQLCGHNETLRQRVFTVTNPGSSVHVKFHSVGNHFSRRGFQLHFSFGPHQRVGCEEGQIRCDNGKCVLPSWRCDGVTQCQDGADEANCPKIEVDLQGSRCSSPYEVDCGPFDSGCFNNRTQRCDGHRDCRGSGLDEDGCPGCPKGTMPCYTHGCYHISQTCDGVPDCHDYTDEADCGFCPHGQVECGSQAGKCYSPYLDRCNGVLDCPLGEDEVDCEPNCKDAIACANGRGCYRPSERCNFIEDCDDGSDELHCKHALRNTLHDKFECDSGGSIAERLWCDGVDDCGDGSDEQGCIRNSVITAAIMGSLLCGLLLVIAVGCTCRLYSLSLKGIGGSSTSINNAQHQSTSASQTTSSSSRSCAALPPMTVFPGDEEFYFREPPPAYSVAVGEVPPPPCPYPYPNSNNAQPRVHNGNDRSRRSRRHSSSRRHPPRVCLGQSPQVPPDLPPLPPYSPTPQGALPPYTPTAAEQTDAASSSSTPQFAPPPTVKVMESLLRTLNSELHSTNEETTSDAAVLVETPPTSPSHTPSASSSHESIA